MEKYVSNVGKLDGSEAFINSNEQLGNRTVGDFWRWAYSDLLQNTTRGVLAEYIVAALLGLDDKPRNPWTSYDLELANGKTIEVKTMSRLQAWAQKQLSIPRVIITPKRSWNPKTGTMEKEPSFNADYYVICYFKAEEHSTANCLDMKQWEFYVLSRERVEEVSKKTKSISLKTLEKLRIKPLEAHQLSNEFL